MGAVPEAYYQFVMDYAPYVYVIPPDTPDPEWGRAAFAAAFAIDFLYEAYSAKQFEDRQTSIYDKIVSLAEWLLTQQCTDPQKKAYGGFKSNENSTYYYAIDACRVIPSLLRAYELTNDADYLNAAKLSGSTFLKTMQDQQTYGGFARAVTIEDAWLLQMDVECLYGLAGLKMLAEKYDVANASLYQTTMSKAVGFLREGFENLWLHYDPADGKWHRVGLSENEVYDDPLAYALVGLYEYEGWSLSCQKVYNFINSIRASAQYPAYNPAVCWAGYIDVISRFAACDYYDAVTSGILWKIRKHHDKSSFAYSMKIIKKHQSEFMFWGVKHDDYGYVENKWAVATVCWLARLFLNYEEPQTRFTQILRSKGENITLYPVIETTETVSYGEGIDTLAIVSPARVEEVLIEPGYIINDYINIYTFTPLRQHDKIRRKGVDYEVLGVQVLDFQGETAYFKARLPEACWTMSEIENPVDTVVRLLSKNMWLVKEDGSLASILVSKEWYDRELFKNYDGQITVGLAESLDTKVAMSGRLRRRLGSLRVNVWATDKEGSSDSGRLMRQKMVEEVNRIVRQNRNKPNETLYYFAGVGQATGTHKAYSAGSATELSPNQAGWSALANVDYEKILYSDDQRYSKSHNVNGAYALMLLRFKVGSREKSVKKIVFAFEGYGTSPAGNGITITVWNHVAQAWQHAQTGTGGADETITITITMGITDFIDDDGYVWLLARTTNPSDGSTPATLYCDYVSCSVTVNGITYLDVVSYRDADRVDVKPFIFRTEFTLKSWSFEDIGGVS